MRLNLVTVLGILLAFAVAGDVALSYLLRHAYRAEGEQIAKAAQCSDANANNANVATRLGLQLGACTDQLASQAAQLDTVESQREAALAAVKAAATASQQQRENAYVHDPSCTDLERIPVCAGIADSLRPNGADHAH